MFTDELATKKFIAVIMALAVIVFFIALFYFAPKASDTSTALTNDFCKELSNDSTSQFIRWGSVGSDPNAPGGIKWIIECTTGLESIRGTGA